MTASLLLRPAPINMFSTDHDTLRAQLTQDIVTLLDHAQLPSPLLDACRYVMTAQGKRVRPLLVMSTFSSIQAAQANTVDITGVHYDMCRRAALAVELLHTYSLVHDDLPCMDDDALRRGQPTCHIVYDEATALLAGDVLQTLAFEVFSADMPSFSPFDPLIASQLCAIFAPRARRMVSGQMLDLNAEARATISQAELEAIHRDKTGALIEAAILMGGVCAGADEMQRSALQTCAQHIGLAFQVQDDILDVTMSTDALGKPAGSDEKLDKSTYVKLMGVDAAAAYAQSLFVDGRAAITDILAQSGTISANVSTSTKISTNSAQNTDYHAAALLHLIDWLWARKK